MGLGHFDFQSSLCPWQHSEAGLADCPTAVTEPLGPDSLSINFYPITPEGRGSSQGENTQLKMGPSAGLSLSVARSHFDLPKTFN